MSSALRIAVVGAESTGKTTLAAALAAALSQRTGHRVAWVPEVLREWCDERGRTPAAHEQAAIAHAQHQRIDHAAAAHDIVVSDTTALMTAVYSRIVFGDRSLDKMAAGLHRTMDATLLMALDLPWVADGLQRDGPQVRQPVDDALRELLTSQRLPFAVVGGQGERRLAQALAAVRAAMRWTGAGNQDDAASDTPAPAGRSLFAGLAGLAGPTGDGASGATGRRIWRCECCVPEAERALMRQR